MKILVLVDVTVLSFCIMKSKINALINILNNFLSLAFPSGTISKGILEKINAAFIKLSVP